MGCQERGESLERKSYHRLLYTTIEADVTESLRPLQIARSVSAMVVLEAEDVLSLPAPAPPARCPVVTPRNRAQ